MAGGGAGHEPGQAGLVGKGMLAAAISGDVFASPSAAQICSGIDLANTDAGVIFIVSNSRHTNFGLLNLTRPIARFFRSTTTLATSSTLVSLRRRLAQPSRTPATRRQGVSSVSPLQTTLLSVEQRVVSSVDVVSA